MGKDINLGKYLDGITLVYDDCYYGEFWYKVKVSNDKVLDTTLLNMADINFYIGLNESIADGIVELEYKGDCLTVWGLSGSNVIEDDGYFKLIQLGNIYYVFTSNYWYCKRNELNYIAKILDGVTIDDIKAVFVSLSKLVRKSNGIYYFMFKDLNYSNGKYIYRLLYTEDGQFIRYEQLYVLNKDVWDKSYKCWCVNLNGAFDTSKVVVLDRATLLEVS